MTVKEAIERRRSYTVFKRGRVPEELVLELVEAASLAPSAANRQNWKFLILHGKDKDSLTDSLVSAAKEKAAIIKSASHAILCLIEKDVAWESEDLLAMGAAIENMLLRGEELGLATLWLSDKAFNEKEVKFALPKIADYELVSIVAVGDRITTPDPMPRKKLAEILIT